MQVIKHINAVITDKTVEKNLVCVENQRSASVKRKERREDG